jgi:hypothetical protein
MGEGKQDALRVEFDTRVRLEFHGSNITSDAGLIAYRELEDALELTIAAENSELKDSRTGKNTRHTLTALLRQSVYSRLAGYEDTNDAERLRVDSAMRHVVGGRATDKTAASTRSTSITTRCITPCRRSLYSCSSWAAGGLFPRNRVGQTRSSRKSNKALFRQEATIC